MGLNAFSACKCLLLLEWLMDDLPPPLNIRTLFACFPYSVSIRLWFCHFKKIIKRAW